MLKFILYHTTNVGISKGYFAAAWFSFGDTDAKCANTDTHKSIFSTGELKAPLSLLASRARFPILKAECTDAQHTGDRTLCSGDLRRVFSLK